MMMEFTSVELDYLAGCVEVADGDGDQAEARGLDVKVILEKLKQEGPKE